MAEWYSHRYRRNICICINYRINSVLQWDMQLKTRRGQTRRVIDELSQSLRPRYRLWKETKRNVMKRDKISNEKLFSFRTEKSEIIPRLIRCWFLAQIQFFFNIHFSLFVPTRFNFFAPFSYFLPSPLFGGIFSFSWINFLQYFSVSQTIRPFLRMCRPSWSNYSLIFLSFVFS